jgi:hypothetical protein
LPVDQRTELKQSNENRATAYSEAICCGARMRLHHIAAFVLAGWYLMVPPRYVIGIPMANWERRAVFDTKAKCENAATLVQGILPPDDVTIAYPGPGYDPQLNSPRGPISTERR